MLAAYSSLQRLQYLQLELPVKIRNIIKLAFKSSAYCFIPLLISNHYKFLFGDLNHAS